MTTLNFHRLTPKSFEPIAKNIATVYVKCFAELPWNEVFDPEGVIQEFRETFFLKTRYSWSPTTSTGSSAQRACNRFASMKRSQTLLTAGGLCTARNCSSLPHTIDAASAPPLRHCHRHLDGTGLRERRPANELHPRARHTLLYMSHCYRPVASMLFQSLKLVRSSVREEFDSRIVMVQQKPILLWPTQNSEFKARYTLTPAERKAAQRAREAASSGPALSGKSLKPMLAQHGPNFTPSRSNSWPIWLNACHHRCDRAMLAFGLAGALFAR